MLWLFMLSASLCFGLTSVPLLHGRRSTLTVKASSGYW